MQTAWPISGLPGLELLLDVRRGHVLAGGVDDQLLLAVDDPQVAVVVECADVAGGQPAVGVDRLGGALGLVAVAGHHDLAADQHLAVVGEPQLDARQRPADRAVAGRRRAGRAWPRRTARTSPTPRRSGSRSRRRTQTSPAARARPRSRTARSDRSPGRPAAARAPIRSAWAHDIASAVGHRLAGLLERDLAQAERDRLGHRGAAVGVGLGLDSRLERRLELLPDPRHAAEPRRARVARRGRTPGPGPDRW